MIQKPACCFHSFSIFTADCLPLTIPDGGCRNHAHSSCYKHLASVDTFSTGDSEILSLNTFYRKVVCINRALDPCRLRVRSGRACCGPTWTLSSWLKALRSSCGDWESSPRRWRPCLSATCWRKRYEGSRTLCLCLLTSRMKLLEIGRQGHPTYLMCVYICNVCICKFT